jgi:hypothetical protein
VSNPGRDHDDVAGAQLHCLAALAAEPDAGPARGDAEHLVCRAVIMMMRVDPIAPSPDPAIAGKEPFAGSGGARTGLKRPAIDDEREQRVIQRPSLIGKQVFFNRRLG